MKHLFLAALMFLLALELGLDRDPEGAIAEMIRFRRRFASAEIAESRRLPSPVAKT